MIASTPSIELLDCNSTTNTPLLELFDYNVILSLPWLGLPDYNITFANGSKKCEHCHGTQKCRESKYLEISSAKGLETHAHEKVNAKVWPKGRLQSRGGKI
jgi:hypothetical protein